MRLSGFADDYRLGNRGGPIGIQFATAEGFDRVDMLAAATALAEILASASRILRVIFDLIFLVRRGLVTDGTR